MSVKNTPDARRWYHAVTAAADYRFDRVSLGGNYTLSYSKGNNDGENVGSGPIMASINKFPEYRQEAWNWPDGLHDERPAAQGARLRLVPAAGEPAPRPD